MRLNPFSRRKALSASPAVIESLANRRINPYPALGGTNVRVNAAYQRGIDASYGWIYATQPAVRSVIDYISRNTAQLGLKLYERKSDTERERQEDHPAAETMRNPDGVTPPDAFIYRLVTDFLIWDNAYAIKFRDPGTQKRVLARVMPNTVTVQGGRFTPVNYWLWREDGSWLGPIAPEDMMHWYGYNPSDPILGLSKLETLRQELATDRAVQTTLVELAKSGLKSGYIKRPLEAPVWDQAAAERFAEEWRAQKQRADGRDPILDEGMTYETVGVSPKDAQIQDMRVFTRDEVAQQYGMEHCPPEDEEERRAFYADVLAPLTESLAGQLCTSLLKAEYGESDYYFEFDLNEKLRGDLENRFPQLTASAGRPWMTVNEVRAKENLPPIEGGDALTLPLNVALEGRGAPALPAPNVMPPQQPLKPPQDGSYRENGKALEVTTLPRPEADMRRQKRFIAEMIDLFERHYTRQSHKLTSKSSKAADTEAWNKELAEDLEKLLKSIGQREGGTYVGRLGGDDFDTKEVENYWAAMAFGIAAAVNHVTQKDIGDLGFAAAFERARNVRAAFAGANIGARATVFARREAAQQSPNPELRTQTWIKNTERHADLHGVSVPLGADWGGISPGSQPNCACTLTIS